MQELEEITYAVAKQKLEEMFQPIKQLCKMKEIEFRDGLINIDELYGAVNQLPESVMLFNKNIKEIKSDLLLFINNVNRLALEKRELIYDALIKGYSDSKIAKKRPTTKSTIQRHRTKCMVELWELIYYRKLERELKSKMQSKLSG